MVYSADRRRALKNQVEYILDSSSGVTEEVIIKAGSPGGQDETFSRTVAAAMRKRSVASSPRDVLPAPHKFLDAGRRSETFRPSASADRRLKRQYSISAQIARSEVTSQQIQILKSEQLDLMNRVLDMEVLQKSVSNEQSRRRKRKGGDDGQPQKFWTSGSFLVRMARDDLHKLYKEEDAQKIEGVYNNRRISIPPSIEPKQVPHSVKDNAVSAWGLRAIGALSVWGAYEARGAGVRVGLLDTGVDAKHPDLVDKIDAWAEFDDKGVQVKNSKPHDSADHGTHCAGTIVGGNASGHWIGVAPQAKIAAALVLNGAKGGTDAQVLAGIDWAIEQEVDVINMSLGGVMWGPEVPSTYTSAIINALRVGIPIVTSIGNEGNQTSGSPGNDLLAFAVGAIDPAGRAAGFTGGRTQVVRESSFFPQDILPLVYSKPEVSAPGVAVKSSVPGGKWSEFNGTSMAAPHVTGAIALLLSATNIRQHVVPSERAFVVQDLLVGSVEELGEAGQDHRFGFGRIDVLRAIGFAKVLGY
jgi:subtilisin family serine protease